MKRQLNPIEKYKPLWEGGKSVEQYNIKVGFKIRMFCVNELNSLRQKNPALFGKNETEQLTKMIMDLKQDKGTISVEDQTCALEDYQQFLSEFFQKVDYEDRHGTVTVKTSSKFRVMASFIDVLASWGPIDPEMLKCKKYCQFKAVDIFKALKKGEVPKRGGPKEQENANNVDAGLGNEIEELSKNVENTNLGNNNNLNNNNDILRGANDQMTSYHSGGNNNNFNNNNGFGGANQMTSYHSGGNNPFGGQQPFTQGTNNQFGNMNNNNGFSNPFGNNNNNMQQHQHQQQNYQQPNSQRNNQNQYQNQNYNQVTSGGSGMNKARKSKVFPSADRNPQKRAFKGKYELNAVIPIKYNSVDYFMLVENVRINNENALRELKRGKASDILNNVLDSLEFLSYIHK